jgi:hypothetical protein
MVYLLGHMINILSGTQTREWMNRVQEELCNMQVYTVDRQMLVIFLIWRICRVEKITKLKRHHHFSIKCKLNT